VRVKSGLIIKEQLSQLVVNTCLCIYTYIYIYLCLRSILQSLDDIANRFFFIHIDSFMCTQEKKKKERERYFSTHHYTHIYISSPSIEKKKRGRERK
jgi:hypothetical protein